MLRDFRIWGETAQRCLILNSHISEKKPIPIRGPLGTLPFSAAPRQTLPLPNLETTLQPRLITLSCSSFVLRVSEAPPGGKSGSLASWRNELESESLAQPPPHAKSSGRGGPGAARVAGASPEGALSTCGVPAPRGPGPGFSIPARGQKPLLAEARRKSTGPFSLPRLLRPLSRL